jgi:glucosylglycerate synthase
MKEQESTLAEETFLSDDFLRQLMNVGEVDVLVGISTHNHAQTIGEHVRIIEECFVHSFPRERCVIILADGGSRDETTEAMLRTPPPTPKSARGITSLRTLPRISTRYADAPQPALALRTILAAAELLRAKGCAVISPDNPNLSCGWIGNLLLPAYREKFDFVAPLYSRHKYDGLLTRNLLYPMTRALFGLRVREMASGEFGFSGRLAEHCLNQDVWREPIIQDRPENWMAITAVSSGFRCCQSYLGQKIRPSSPQDVVAAVRQTVGTLFWCLESLPDVWTERAGSEAVPTFGPDHELTLEPFPVNRERLFEMFRGGVSDLDKILASVLSADVQGEIRKLASLDGAAFHYRNDLWAQTLQDFAASYHHGVLNQDHLVQALVPLYRGRIYSFLLQHDESSPDEIEIDTENLCLELENRKPGLVELWKSKSEVKS